MGDIRVIIDPEAQASPSCERLIQVHDEVEYWRARDKMRQCAERGEPLLVWVTASGLAARFDDLRVQEGVVVDYDPRHELSQLLGCPDVPALLTGALIGEFGLVRLAGTSPPLSGEGAVTWTLRQLSADVWGRPRPSDASLSDVVEALAVAPPMPQSLEPLASARLQEWASDGRAGPLWRWLAGAPIRRAHCLVCVWATQGYGPTAAQWLQQEGMSSEETAEAACQLRTCGPALRLPERLLGHRLRQLMGLRLQAAVSEQGAMAVDSVAAGTPEELQCVERYLGQRADEGHPLSAAEAAHLVRMAERLPDSHYTRHVARATAWLTQQPFPSLLEPGADWRQTQHWLQDDYMPSYPSRSLCSGLAETEPAALSFEDWLLDNYQDVVSVGQAGVNAFVSTRPLDEARQALLLVLIDGAPAILMREFAARLVHQAGLHVLSDGLRLSLLPTRTGPNRRGLLSGRLPDQSGASDASSLAGVLRVAPDSVRTVSDITEAQTIGPGTVVFWHYRELDEDWLHKPHRPLTRWLGAMDALDGLAQRLRAACELARSDGVELLLGCISDHGWTEIPTGCAVVPLPDTQANRASHGRVLDGCADPQLGRGLDRHRFYLEEDGTIASAYSVLGRRPQGAVHGGATPQEAVVYGVWCSTVAQTAAHALGLEITGEVRRAVSDNPVKVTIANPNGCQVVVTGLGLTGVHVEPGQLPLPIQGGLSGHLDARCACEGTASRIEIKGEIEWRPDGGTQQQQSVMIQLPTTGAAQTDEAFESMFDS